VGPKGGPDFVEKRMELVVESVIQKVRNSREKWKTHTKNTGGTNTKENNEISTKWI
jgi:hypothetical protein